MDVSGLRNRLKNNPFKKIIGVICVRIGLFTQKEAKVAQKRKEKNIYIYLVWTNKPFVHSGGVSRGTVCDCGC